MAVATDGNHQPSALYSIDLHDTTSLQGLIDFSIQNQIAIGVVLSPHAGLCTTQRRLVLKNVTAEKIMDGLLRHSGYIWTFDKGVFVISPKSMPASSEQILHLRYPSFKSPETTLQGLGIVLSSSINSALDPNAGSAFSILSSSDSKTIKPVSLENVTVEQIANHIVSLNGKGAWILDPNPYESGKSGKSVLHIYGYEDDARVLRNLPCPTQAQIQ
jgi:hypothetical protein